MFKSSVNKYSEISNDTEKQLDKLVNDGWKIIGFGYQSHSWAPIVLLQKWE